MYVYGGMSGAGITNEIWWFDLSINLIIIFRKVRMV